MHGLHKGSSRLVVEDNKPKQHQQKETRSFGLVTHEDDQTEPDLDQLGVADPLDDKSSRRPWPIGSRMHGQSFDSCPGGGVGM